MAFFGDAARMAQTKTDAKLWAAVERLKLDKITAALDAGADPDGGATPGQATPLYSVLVMAGGGEKSPKDCIRAAKLLLERGADPDGRDYASGKPLIRAAALGDVELVRLLLDRGADVNVESYKDTPLVNAMRYDQLATARLLLTRGARPDEMSFRLAIAEGDVGLVAAMLEAGAAVTEVVTKAASSASEAIQGLIADPTTAKTVLATLSPATDSESELEEPPPARRPDLEAARAQLGSNPLLATLVASSPEVDARLVAQLTQELTALLAECAEAADGDALDELHLEWPDAGSVPSASAMGYGTTVEGDSLDDAGHIKLDALFAPLSDPRLEAHAEGRAPLRGFLNERAAALLAEAARVAMTPEALAELDLVLDEDFTMTAGEHDADPVIIFPTG